MRKRRGARKKKKRYDKIREGMKFEWCNNKNNQDK